MKIYLTQYGNAPEHLKSWNESIFHAFVEFVIVYRNDVLEFVFKNGSKIKVAIED